MKDSKVIFHKLNPFTDFEKVKDIWRDLQSKSPHSFFLSWAWMDAWLKCLPEKQNISFIYGTVNDQPFIAYFIGIKKGFDNSFVYCSRAFLNSTGDEQQDEITIEYNGVLLDQSLAPKDITGLFSKDFSQWDELVCPAVKPEWLDSLDFNNSNLNTQLIESTHCYYVELDKVRANNNDLLPLLSKNKRAQINRSIRCYEEDGDLKITVANDVEQALSFLNKLEILHQKNWVQKGHPGSFDSDFFREFHINLITDNFDSNCTQLLVVTSGDEALGYLYNFIYKNKVFFYQSGLNYREGNLYRPGLICHYLAINYYAAQGYEVYDFLAGDSAYKKSLSTNSCKLYWLKIRRKKIIFKVEEALKNIKSFFLNR